MRSRVDGGPPEHLGKPPERRGASFGRVEPLASQLPRIWGKSQADPPSSRRNSADATTHRNNRCRDGIVRRTNRDRMARNTRRRAKLGRRAIRPRVRRQSDDCPLPGSQRLIRRHRGFLRVCCVGRSGRRFVLSPPRCRRCKQRGCEPKRSCERKAVVRAPAIARDRFAGARSARSRSRNAMAAEARR